MNRMYSRQLKPNQLKGNVYIIIQSDEYGYSYMGMR